MKFKFYLIIVSYIITISCLPVTAKEFKIISLDDFTNINKIRFQDVSTPRNINITKYSSNMSYQIPTNDTVYFYGVDSNSGASSRKPILSISFADQESDTIVLLKKDNESENIIKYEFLKNDSYSFPILSTIVLNLSEKKVVIKLGNEIVKIEPKSKKMIPLPQNKRGSFSEKVVFAALNDDKTIEYFYSSFWRVPSGRKTLSIIDFDTESKSHKLVEILI